MSDGFSGGGSLPAAGVAAAAVLSPFVVAAFSPASPGLACLRIRADMATRQMMSTTAATSDEVSRRKKPSHQLDGTARWEGATEKMTGGSHGDKR